MLENITKESKTEMCAAINVGKCAIQFFIAAPVVLDSPLRQPHVPDTKKISINSSEYIQER